MDQEEIITGIRRDYESILQDVHSILLYGSWAAGEEHEGSDIDICLVAHRAEGLILLQRKALGLSRNERHDVRVFELLPLYLKAEVIEKGAVVYSQDVYELYEYFYFFRKQWDEQKQRQTLSRDEALAMFGESSEG